MSRTARTCSFAHLPIYSSAGTNTAMSMRYSLCAVLYQQPIKCEVMSLRRVDDHFFNRQLSHRGSTISNTVGITSIMKAIHCISFLKVQSCTELLQIILIITLDKCLLICSTLSQHVLKNNWLKLLKVIAFLKSSATTNCVSLGFLNNFSNYTGSGYKKNIFPFFNFTYYKLNV